MSKTSILKDALGKLETNKPLTLPKSQNFIPPDFANVQDESEGKSPQGNLPQGEPPQGSLPAGKLPGDADIQLQDFHQVQANRANRRRQAMVKEAPTSHFQLSQGYQQYAVVQYQALGWGRLAHCISRQLKAPSRYGLKLVDIAIIMTIYDSTLAAFEPRIFAPIHVGEFEKSTGMDQKNLRTALKRLVDHQSVLKISWKSVNFWGLNLNYFQEETLGSGYGSSPQGKLPWGKCARYGQQLAGEIPVLTLKGGNR